MQAVRGTGPRPLTLCAVLLALWVSACSSATERLAGWYITRQIDSYLDLSSVQKRAVRARVDEQLHRLRQSELPRWLYVLRETRDTLQRGASESQLITLQQRYDRLLDDAVTLLTPDVAAVLAELSEAQIAHFERRLRERQDETYEERELAPQERRAKTDEQVCEAIESLVGDLSDEQRRAVSKLVQALPDERPERYEVERRRIAAAGQFLRTHPGAPAIEAELKRLWQTRYDGLGKGRDIGSRRAEQRAFLQAVDRLLTGEQRAHAVETMDKLIRRAKRLLATPE